MCFLPCLEARKTRCMVDWKEKNANGCVSLSALMCTCVVLEGAPVSLKQLSLASNGLSSIDLEPLMICSNLKSLILNGNAIAQLDLSPLSLCPELEKLWLHNNLLRRINLDALSECHQLRSLYLDGNRIHDHSIDLSPLKRCIALRSLRLSRNMLAGKLDISPLLDCKSLMTCDVSASVCLTAEVSTTSSPHSTLDTLPPAFRRKAATVVWRTVSDVTWEVDDSMYVRRAMECDAIAPNHSMEISSSLTVLLLGFRGNAKYSVETLIKEYGGMRTLTFVDLIPAVKVSMSALRTCHSILLRGRNIAGMLLGLRSLDHTVPIFGVQSLDNESDDTLGWHDAGATGVFREPLLGRHIAILKACALERFRSKNPRLGVNSDPINDRFHGMNDCFASSRIPTSPVTSSESSPPSGVPAFTDNLRTSPHSERAAFSCGIDQYENISPRESRIFNEPRDMPSVKTFFASSRIEESSLSMTFSRLGGYASRSDFDCIATICGMPACTGELLHDAVKIWSRVLNRSLTPIQSDEWNSASLKRSELVSYKNFETFWKRNLRTRDCDDRLFFIVALRDNFASTVSIQSLVLIADNFVKRRNSSVNYPRSLDEGSRKDSTGSLAGQIMLYELSGIIRSRLTRKEFIQTGFCSSLLAAESGVYSGVTFFLRSDRMLEIEAAFCDALRNGKDGEKGILSLKAATAFNFDHGFLISRAVEAHFNLLGGSSGISVVEFAPMWLAAKYPASSVASSYFFHLLDIDLDGYLNSFDVMHFYSEKYRMLIETGFVPVEFEHLWRSISDNISGRPSEFISHCQLKSVPERERLLFWQTVLFVQDELNSVNIRETIKKGTLHAVKVASSAF